MKFLKILLCVFLINCMLMDANVFASKSELCIYLSPCGNDETGNGTLKKPYFSLKRAQKDVRLWLKSGTKNDINVVLRGGEYQLTEEFLITEAYSVNDKQKIIYRAYKDEIPVISGGKALTKWEKYSDNIYYTDVDDAVYSLFEDDIFATKARYPNKGEKRSDGYLNTYALLGDGTTGFQFKENEIPYISNQTDLQAYIWDGTLTGEAAWSLADGKAEIDYTTNSVTVTGGKAAKFGVGTRYYMQNAIEFLDMQGEYYYDSTNKKLYYIPYNEDNLSNRNIKIGVVNKLITVTGKENKYIKNIEFNGLSFENSAGTETTKDIIGCMLSVHFGDNVTVKNCRFFNCGGRGINFQNTQNCTAYGNYIKNMGYEGIYLNGIQGNNNTLQNNFISDIGLLDASRNGILVAQQNNNFILNNCIKDVPRAAISLSGTLRSDIIGTTVEGTLVTEKNVENYLVCGGNTIMYNDISNAMLETNDGGVYYTWSTGNGNLFSYNYIHDSAQHVSFGYPIYLDDDTNYHTVSKNLIRNMYEDGGIIYQVIMAKGQHNTIENNIIADCTPRNGVLKVEYETRFGPVGNVHYNRNIHYNSGGTAYAFFKKDFDTDYECTKLYEADNNLFYDENEAFDAEVWINTYGKYYTLADFEGWKTEYGYDKNSQANDPLFVNPQKGDFRLNLNSPALLTGFEEIDYAKIGLTKDFRYNTDEEIRGIYLSSENENQSDYMIYAQAGDEIQLSYSVKTESGFNQIKASVIFVSSDRSVATVTKDGKISVLNDGEAYITAVAYYNGKILTKAFRIKAVK